MVNEVSEEEFKKLENPIYDLEEEKESSQTKLKEAYLNIVDVLKEYLDIKEEYYSLIALWIIGTYFHENFPSYPYLYFNAMKGSGKSRAMALITVLSHDGDMLNSLTEAVLFRSKGTLAIDEFEGIERKGKEGLRELLNSAYKKGAKVKRMKKSRTEKGEEQVVEEFDVYRPIVMANIWGMENVLEDRCLTLILERSNKKEITDLVEIFREQEIVKQTIKILNEIKSKEQCSLCNVVYLWNIYQKWNEYVKQNNTIYNNNIYYNNNINYTQVLETIKFTGIGGRNLELCLPLFLVALEIDPKNEEIFKETTLTLKDLISVKKDEEFSENRDVSLIDYISQLPTPSYFISMNKISNDFKEFLQTQDDDINPKWLGRALKRLNLIIEKRRISAGVEVKLNVKKAQEKIQLFK